MKNTHTTHARPTHRLRTFSVSALTCAAMILSGCDSTFFRQKDYLGRAIPPEETRTIQTRELVNQSTVPPVTVEQAASAINQDILGPPAPPAQVNVSLADVRAAALQNNLDLRVEVINPSIAQEVYDAEAAKFEAAFFANANYTRTDSPTENVTVGSQSTIQNYEAGVTVPLRTGGTAVFSVPISEIETNTPAATLNPAFAADLAFSISQPILQGAGVNVNTHSIRVASYEQTISEARAKLESIRVLANADRAYWRLYASRRELEVRQKQYELAVAQLERAQRRVEAGDAAQIEVTRAQSGVAQSLEGIITAQAAIRRTQRDLKRIMNRPDLPMSSATEVLTATDPTPLGLKLDSQALADTAVANRMEMLELELQLAIDASTIDFQRNAKLPLVMVDYNYNFTSLSSSYGRAFDQLGEFNFNEWTLGLQAQIPIGNEAAEANFNRAVLQRLQRLATKELRELAIRQEVLDALDQLDENWQRILAARQESILAGRTYEAEKRQFEVGVRTSTDVLDAAARLADAQSREVIALAEYQIAQIDIAFATGTLLGLSQVQWQPFEIPPSEADPRF